MFQPVVAHPRVALVQNPGLRGNEFAFDWLRHDYLKEMRSSQQTISKAANASEIQSV